MAEDASTGMFPCCSTTMPAFLPFLLSSALNWTELNARVYHDGRNLARLSIRVSRLKKETQVTVLFPNNPVARESVTRYVEALKSVYVRVAEGHGAAAPVRNTARV